MQYEYSKDPIILNDVGDLGIWICLETIHSGLFLTLLLVSTVRRLYPSPFSCSLTYGSRGQVCGVNRTPCWERQASPVSRNSLSGPVCWWSDGWATQDRSGIGGKKRRECWMERGCYIMELGYLSGSVEWSQCDDPGQAVPERRRIQTHPVKWDQSVSGFYLTLCFSWTCALCHGTITFARGIIPFLHLRAFLKNKYCLLLQANSSLQLLSNSYRPM